MNKSAVAPFTTMPAMATRITVPSITGAGDAEISAQQDADITIIGAGSVRLMTEPKNLRTNIIGAGYIIHARR